MPLHFIRQQTVFKSQRIVANCHPSTARCHSNVKSHNGTMIAEQSTKCAAATVRHYSNLSTGRLNGSFQIFTYLYYTVVVRTERLFKQYRPKQITTNSCSLKKWPYLQLLLHSVSSVWLTYLQEKKRIGLHTTHEKARKKKWRSSTCHTNDMTDTTPKYNLWDIIHKRSELFRPIHGTTSKTPQRLK